jgi:uncharacterized protein with ATP-grasp and redox domains
MRFHPDCYSCTVQQILGASRYAGAEEAQQFTILRRVLEALQEIDLSLSPAEDSGPLNHIVQEVTGVADPYARYKAESTRLSLELYPQLRQRVSGASDPLEVALRLAIAGNIIDVVHTGHKDLDIAIERALTQPLSGGGLEAFRQALARARGVLYLGDNAGETVFDRLLVEQLGKPVTYAVKGGPILNDATLEDALAAGLDQVATLVSNGSRSPGTVLQLCTAEFRHLFATADLVIAKGQSNYEMLSHADERLFFLLQVKCPVVGQDLGLPQGSAVVRQGGWRQAQE